MKKIADSLNDEELKSLADYYNKNRNDRLSVPGDVGRFLLSAGSLPATMMYDLNRTGGTQMLAPLIGRKAFTYRSNTKKEVDGANAVLKAMWTGLGGLAGAGIGHLYSDTDKAQNTAIGGAVGASYAFLLMHLAQKLGQNRARKMLKKIEDEKQMKAASEKRADDVHSSLARDTTIASMYPVIFGGLGAGVGALVDRKKRARGALIGLLSGLGIGTWGAVAENRASASRAKEDYNHYKRVHDENVRIWNEERVNDMAEDLLSEGWHTQSRIAGTELSNMVPDVVKGINGIRKNPIRAIGAIKKAPDAWELGKWFSARHARDAGANYRDVLSTSRDLLLKNKTGKVNAKDAKLLRKALKTIISYRDADEMAQVPKETLQLLSDAGIYGTKK